MAPKDEKLCMEKQGKRSNPAGVEEKGKRSNPAGFQEKQGKRSNPAGYSRRQLLQGAAATAAGITLAGCGGKERSPLILAKNETRKVHILRCPDYSRQLLRRKVEEGWNAIGAPSPKGLRVLLKPNFVEYTPGVPINTDPAFVAAFIEFMRDRGAKSITVAEGPGHRHDSDEVWIMSGLRAKVLQLGAKLVDLNYADLVSHTVGFNWLKGTKGVHEKMWLPKLLFESDLLVTLPKLKTHHWVKATLSLKNIFGIVPGVRYGWPKNILHWIGIERAIVALNKAVPFHVGVIDGIVGMEGDGPLRGTAVPSGVILFSRDLVALDGAAAMTMGIEPKELTYFALAQKASLGSTGEIVYTGLKPKEVARPFERPPKS